MNVLVRRPLRGAARIDIEASPELVWSLVADVPRMGEWSPECRRCDWAEGFTDPIVGARFRGYNRFGLWRWHRDVLVTAAEPGIEFAFVTLGTGNAEQTRWQYRFVPMEGGTEVRESFEGVTRPLYVHLWLSVPGMTGLRRRQLERGMVRTLERLKLAAETGREMLS
jgi:hypothetical protein